jgi:DNA-binding NtrC family response regulator
MTTLRILIADDELPARFGMAKALAHADCEVLEAANGPAALEAIRRGAADLVFLDLNMPELSGQEVLKRAAESRFAPEIIVVTANDSVQAAVECMRLGASDYITKPYEVEQLRAIARRVARRLELERQVDHLQHQLGERAGLGGLIGSSHAMRELFRQMQRAAAAPVDILIRGETGTGKELIAREIHNLSARSAGPFVAVNTAAIAESLAESELFGHTRGAFTGADRERAGVFEQAQGGTLFLDEIGDMPLPTQAKILRALQERTVQPIGSNRNVSVDVRVISATHQDLAQAVGEGLFRQDLYYRIKGVEFVVSPLRERREDVLLLANHFLNLQPSSADAPAAYFAPDAVDALLSYNWPGNVRELQHTVRAARAMTAGDTIHARDLRLPLAQRRDADFDFSALAELPLSDAKSRLVETFERQTIQRALETAGGNVSAAARQLGIHRQSLQQKMAQLGIERG